MKKDPRSKHVFWFRHTKTVLPAGDHTGIFYTQYPSHLLLKKASCLAVFSKRIRYPFAAIKSFRQVRYIALFIFNHIG